jgi:hypothetical protein
MNSNIDEQEQQTDDANINLIENQFNILEALASIQYKLDIKPDEYVLTPAHQDGLETRLRQQIGDLK